MQEIQARTSERFCVTDADVTFRSCDDVLISVHRKNLETHTGGFPPGEFDAQGQTIPLPEASVTLELLFQFIYPQKHPDLKSTEIAILAPLAEAAEKYEVYSAMNICEVRMRNFIDTHPPEVLAYAARHGYLDILDEVAPLALGSPLQDVIVILPQSMAISWVCYYEQWAKVLLAGVKDTHHCGCTPSNSGWGSSRAACRGCGGVVPHRTSWASSSSKILQKLGEGVGSLTQIGPLFEGCIASSDSCCAGELRKWRQTIDNEMSLAKAFRSFL